MQSEYEQIKFSDKDIVNIDDYIPAGDYNPHNVRPWLLHDHGTVICVVFAGKLQDALDEAVNCDKLDHYMIDQCDESDREDYIVEPTLLGNAGEPFDIEGVEAIELPNPPMSFCALFNAAQAVKS